MGYFDSTKNRALWDIRLAELRQERAAREAGGEAGPVRQETPEKQAISSVRVPVSYQQLLREEAMASERGRKRGREAMEAGRQRARERDLGQERQREAEAYEKR